MTKFIAVMSGKGGVGKSSICMMIAAVVSEKYKTLILDFDICGPSIVCATKADGKLVKSASGFHPVFVNKNLAVISFGLILNPDDTVIWRGAKKLGFLELFFNSIEGFDYIVIDTPPGISEEHGFLRNKNIDAILITTPQNIALNDTQRCIEFCKSSGIEIVGLIENMSYYKCENCLEKHHPFGSKGGKQLAAEYDINFLEELEIDPKWSESMDDGTFIDKYHLLKVYGPLKEILMNNGII